MLTVIGGIFTKYKMIPLKYCYLCFSFPRKKKILHFEHGLLYIFLDFGPTCVSLTKLRMCTQQASLSYNGRLYCILYRITYIALYIVATVSQLIFILRSINKYYELILVCYDFCFKIALKYICNTSI